MGKKANGMGFWFCSFLKYFTKMHRIFSITRSSLGQNTKPFAVVKNYQQEMPEFQNLARILKLVFSGSLKAAFDLVCDI